MRLMVETDDEGGAAVYELRPVMVARFADRDEARRYADWRLSALVRQAAHDDIAAVQQRNDAVAETLRAAAAEALRTQGVPAPQPAADDDGTAAAEPEEITETASPASALPADPAPQEIAAPPALDPYGEAGEAFRRLKAGEQLGTVADDLRLSMPKLRSRWARYQQGLKAQAWEPGATVARAAEAPLEDGWAHCDRCRTKFNAARAQADMKLPQRPTRCAACRS